jgi:hypothetical protein
LPYNTKIYFNAYAANAVGTSSKTGSITTQIAGLDFEALDYTVTTVYDSVSDKYRLTVPVIPRDLSTYVAGITPANVPIPRNIPYEVKVETANGSQLLGLYSGTMDARYLYTTPTVTNATFSNIPFGFIRVTVNVNYPPSIYPETLASSSNNTRAKILNLSDPKDIVTSGSSGFGPVLTDPGFELDLGNQLIRSGNETSIIWDTKVSYSMDCRIIGPSTFGTNGVFQFNPAIDGVIGSVSTGILTSTQIFKLTCTEPVTGSSFSATTRIDVLGELKEI